MALSPSGEQVYLHKPFCLGLLKLYTSFLVLFLVTGTKVVSQPLTFRHLSVKEGMPSNVSYYACFDSTGGIWFSTNDGLINYNGVNITQYLKETHPGLPDNNTGYLFCDSHNRIWVCANRQAAVVNAARKISPLVIHDSLRNARIEFFFEVKGLGVVAVLEKSTCILYDNKQEWEKLEWFDRDVRNSNRLFKLKAFDSRRFMFECDENTWLVDFIERKIMLKIHIPDVSNFCRLNDKELIAVTADKWNFYRIDIASGRIIKNYSRVLDQDKNPVSAPAVYVEKAADNKIYIITINGRLLSFSPDDETFFYYPADLLNEGAITSRLIRIFCSHNGNMFITSLTGVNYTNVLYSRALAVEYFKDKEGHIYSGAVTAMAEDNRKRMWLKTPNEIFIWEKNKSFVAPVRRNTHFEIARFSNDDPGAVEMDSDGNMWAGSINDGIQVFGPGGTMIKTITNGLPATQIRKIKRLNDGRMIIGCNDGLFIINPRNFSIDSFNNDPLLKAIAGKRFIDIMPDGNKAWFAVSPSGAAYCYDFAAKQLVTYDVTNGLSSDRVYCLGKDFEGNIYAGTFDGLNIITRQGAIKKIGKENGLRFPRIENIITDKDGNLWMTNFNSVLRYNPRKKEFTYYDEKNGVSNTGFQVTSSCGSSSGNLLFGTINGIAVLPPQLAEAPAVKRINIDCRFDDAARFGLPVSDTIYLDYSKPTISFSYYVPDLVNESRYLYRYKLEKRDTGWSNPTKAHEISYNLKPGKYIFKIQFSYTEDKWVDPGNKIVIIIKPPFWQTFLFRVLLASAFLGIVFIFYKRRVGKIKKDAAIRQQMTELESKALRAQMNPHFIFNSLNAIQELIVTSRVEEGYKYLSAFSKLLRMVLNSSEKEAIPLSTELQILELQLSLEALRFQNSFSYTIDASGVEDPDMINIPPLLLQPYVENAVWHGLRNKEGDKKLRISAKEDRTGLHVEIEDNGVGRKEAEEIKKHQLGAGQFESKGSALSQQRIKLLNEKHPGLAWVQITDLADKEGNATGTKVVIFIPSNTGTV